MGKRARKARGRGGHPGRPPGPRPPPETRTIFSELVASSIREAEMLLLVNFRYIAGLARADPPDASTSIEIVNIDV